MDLDGGEHEKAGRGGEAKKGAGLAGRSPLCTNLALLKTALGEAEMRKAAQDHVKEVVEGLTGALVLEARAGAGAGSEEPLRLKRSALECIALLKDLPHYAIHPYFHFVRRKLQTCLDDATREVRLQAGRTLRVWTAEANAFGVS